MKTIKWYRERGVFDDLQVVPANDHKRLLDYVAALEQGCRDNDVEIVKECTDGSGPWVINKLRVVPQKGVDNE
jgi:hypothetical protein